MARLTVNKEINSTHGKKVHGHTFKIEIKFEGKLKDGMVDGIDFHDIMPKIDDVINGLDNKYLDDVLQTRATVENVATYIINKLSDEEGLYSVIVWEGADKYVEVFKEEILGGTKYGC